MKFYPSFSILFIFLITLMSCGNNKEFSKTENIQVIPKNAAIIIEGRNLKKTRELVTEVEFSKLFTENNEFSTLYNSIDNLNKELEKNGASIWMSKDYSMSLHTTGSKEFGHLFIVDDIREDALKSINKAFNKKEITLESYENQTINHLGKFGLSFVQVNQFFILSTSKILIKDAIRQHGAPTDLPSDPHFKNAFKEADRSEFCNIYVQTKELISIFEMTYKSSFSFLNNIDEWLALDLNIDSDRILLTGMCTAKEDNRLHKLMFGKKGLKTNVFEYLPSNTHFFVSKVFPDMEQYMTSRIKTLEHQQRLKQWKAYKKKLTYNAKDFLKTLGNEYTYAICGSELNPNNAVGFVKIEEMDNAKKYLTISDLPKYRGYQFRELADNKFFDFVLGDYFKDFNKSKCIIIDEYAIFSNELSNLKSIVNDYIGKNTLESQESFMQLKDELSSRSNVWIYLSEDALSLFPAQMARKQFVDQQKEVGHKIKNLGKIFAQVKVDDDSFKINIVGKNPKKEWKSPKLKAEWSIELDNKFTMAPQKLWNHVDKRNEIALQDNGNILYLISERGKILWKKQLDEKVIGSIKQIDIYKNNRLQMLVQTKSKIHLFDRNGEMVKGYPIVLPSPSSAEMAVFDYNQTKSYRLLVPCNEHLAMFNQNGEAVKGWKAYNQDYPIIKKPQHFIIDDKDYILTENKNKTLFSFKRNGDIRSQLQLNTKSHENSSYVLVNSTNPNFKMISYNNMINVFDSENTLQSSEISQERIFDINMNSETLSYLTKDEFIIEYNEDKFSYDLEVNNEHTQIVNYQDNLFSVLDMENEKVYVFNKEAKLLDQFPIYGSTNILMTEMSNQNEVNLYIGGSDGTLYSYKMGTDF